MGKVTEVFSFL